MITKIANAIAKAHILHHKAEFNVVAVSDTSYLCTVTHKDRSLIIEEVINTSNFPQDIAEEYMHCRIHSLAAKLIQKLYPETL